MFYDTSVENALRLYNVGWVEGQETDVWVYGTYQTNLRYFSFSAFPRTIKEAREKLSNPRRLFHQVLYRLKRFLFPAAKNRTRMLESDKVVTE